MLNFVSFPRKPCLPCLPAGRRESNFYLSKVGIPAGVYPVFIAGRERQDKDMMLYINTTDEEKVALALGKAGKLIAKREFKAKYRQSETLLPAIDLLLAKNKIKLSDLLGVVVVKGPGPFTATRIGVTVANALAYGLNIKIAGLRAGEVYNI